jgi:hypothetical protein
MGQEVECMLRDGGRELAGRAHLDTDELVFRGEGRLRIPYQAISAVTAEGGVLIVDHPAGRSELVIGERAERWAQAILHPKTVVDKLGVKPGQRVALVGISDPDFERRLEERGARLVGAAALDVDHLFVAVETALDLDRLGTHVARIARDGAVWTLRRKGRRDLTEADVMTAGKAAGLVDVKVVRFSDTHTAEKFVIPVARR